MAASPSHWVAASPAVCGVLEPIALAVEVPGLTSGGSRGAQAATRPRAVIELARARQRRQLGARCSLARMKTGVRIASSMALALVLAAGVTTVHEEAAVAQANGRTSPA